ncbi:DUF5302 domain-containing protein [Cumulibacter manganitolerans]|uniref:DUF5302 domain-containing protein n=1 Tax=Cumulibacter manganitolerans TaxID=1884992 RepID=UPI0012960C8A|nr:DUF5302 domain-containing protein [Cumulibacter manganitolerans]
MSTESTQDHSGAPEDIKAKFREALEKKHQRNHRHEDEAGAHGDSKAHGEHRRSGNDKTFRRKSG